VDAAHSTTGGALLASDPHLSLNLPNLWLTVGMRSPSYDIVGMMVPGLPVMGFGRNRHIAWGGTNLRSASSDAFDIASLIGKVSNMESIDVRNGGEGSVDISSLALTSLTDANHSLTVKLDAGDILNITGGATTDYVGSGTDAGGGYFETYTMYASADHSVASVGTLTAVWHAAA
jgi:hypothetical protein